MLNSSRLCLLGAVAALLAACGQTPHTSEGLTLVPQAVYVPPSTTSVQVTPTLTLSWTRAQNHDWTVVKTADVATAEITLGQSRSVTYTVTPTRTTTTEDRFGASGQACVLNTGASAASGVRLSVTLVRTLDGSDRAVAARTLLDGVSLPSSPSDATQICAPFSFEFATAPEGTYRVDAAVTLTNGEPASGSAGAALPATPGAGPETDATATVQDVFTCPAGFECTPSASHPGAPVTITEPIRYTVTYRNVSVGCDQTLLLNNTVTLTEGTTGQTRQSTTSVPVGTGSCGVGCTLTIGYWKTHAGFTGNNADRVTPLLPIDLGDRARAVTPNRTVTVTTAAQAVTILDRAADSSNGINKLMAQLLAAKLNIRNGASGAGVAGLIGNADTALATFASADWSRLNRSTQNKIISWATDLDRYNNGLIGPGHCAGE